VYYCVSFIRWFYVMRIGMPDMFCRVISSDVNFVSYFIFGAVENTKCVIP